jgi:Spy/CpxP family protein refolding chaperone
MKTKILTIVAATAMAAGMSFAQSAPAPQNRMGTAHRSVSPHAQNRRAHRQAMMQELNLTPAQKTQAKNIFQGAWQSSRPIFQQLRQNNQALAAAVRSNDTAKIRELSAAQGNLRGQMVANHEMAMAQFYQILTPEQRTKADQIQQKAQSRMQERFNQMQQEHQPSGE